MIRQKMTRPSRSDDFMRRVCITGTRRAASALSDVVLCGHDLTVLQKTAHHRLEIMIGLGRAGTLVQVIGPGRDDEALDIPRRIAEVTVEAPDGRAVAPPRRAQQ